MDMYRHGKHEDIPRVMYPPFMAQKIGIPTIHVCGQNDYGYMIKMAELCRSLCHESMAKRLVHNGSHHVPKRQNEVKAVVRAVDWAMARL